MKICKNNYKKTALQSGWNGLKMTFDPFRIFLDARKKQNFLVFERFFFQTVFSPRRHHEAVQEAGRPNDPAGRVRGQRAHGDHGAPVDRKARADEAEAPR